MLQRRPFTQPARPDRAPMAWPGVQSFAPATRADGMGAAQAKPDTYRDAALLAMAKGKPCLLQIPGICTSNSATVVACHENEGKGMAIKASDARSCQGCFACHTAYDQGKAPRETKRAWFAAAHARQVAHWQKVAGDMSYTPRERRAAHAALCELFEPENDFSSINTGASSYLLNSK